jgi:hypothetical protein
MVYYTLQVQQVSNCFYLHPELMLLVNNRNRSNKTIVKWHKNKRGQRWLKRVGGQNCGLKNRARGGSTHEGGAHEGG